VGTKARQTVWNFLKGNNGKNIKEKNVLETTNLFLQVARIMMSSGKSSIYKNVTAP